jgi:6-phosphogluconolactonase
MPKPLETRLLIGRRTFLSGAIAGTAGMLTGQTRSSSRVLLYVGTYSSPQGPEGSSGRGKGIELFEMSPANGRLQHLETVANDANPSCVAINPARTFLYSANEIRNYEGKDSGSVSAYAINRSDGRLKLLNTVNSEGAGPAHMSVHPAGKFVLVANYFGGTVTVLPIQSDGSLGHATDTKLDDGPLGKQPATSAPAGSFAMSGHDRSHAHMIQADPSGRFVISTDLGMDRIFVWRFDSDKGTLSLANAASVPSGDGPRHFAYHPNGRWFYSIQEEGSTLVLFDYDPKSGSLTTRKTITTLPKGFTGTNYTSEVMVSADGRFVYGANRLHDTIAVFAVGKTGELSYVAETWTRGDYPRSFNIDPSGNFLYCCNQRSDAITTFRVNRRTGELTFTGDYTPVGTPSNIAFLA